MGYAISRTGPFAPGAQVTQEPNYILWAEQVNAAGGLDVKGHKRKIELIGYDDRSEVETAVRTFEKLMTTDKVDLILPPWGSTMNFAVAPLANRHGYPVLAPTALSMKLIEMKLPYFFSMLPQAYVLMNAAAEMLAARGVKTVAVIYMDDLFGLENIAAFEPAVKAKGIEIVDKKSYPARASRICRRCCAASRTRIRTPSWASPIRPIRSWSASSRRRSPSTRGCSTRRSAPPFRSTSRSWAPTPMA